MAFETLSPEVRDAMLAAVLRASLDCIVVIDEDGIVLEFNRAAELTFGWPRAAVVGSPLSDFIVPHRMRQAHADGLARYLREGRSRILGRRIEITALRADGTEFPAELAITETAVGSKRFFAASIRDITDRQAARAALDLSEKRLAAFMAHAPVGMYLKDGEGRFVMANPEMAHVFGRPVDEILGRRSEDMLPPQEAAVVAINDRRIRETRQAHSVEEHIPGLDRYAWTLVVRFPIEVEAGQPVYIGGFDIDITTMKDAEAELTRSRQALHQNEKLSALGLLLAGVAHELNNPLAILVGQSALLQEDVAGGPLASRADKIQRAAERCAKIVRTFLSIARQNAPVRQTCNLVQIAQAAVDLLAYSFRTSGVTTTVLGSPEGADVLGDPDQLHQVVVNLLVNAQQALADRELPRSVEIRIARRGDQVVMDVADNGAGVRPDIADRIFEPFFTTKAVGRGTGIGLSFSYGVVLAHDGTLELVANTKGATFRMSLPAYSAQDAPRPTPSPHSADPLFGVRVLIVEDEAEVAATLSELLEDLSVRVAHAPSGEAALALLSEAEFDAILCDLRMPGMGGPAFFRILQEERPHLAERTGFVTGDSLSPAASDFLAAAARAVLAKPFTRSQVQEMLRTLVSPPSDPANRSRGETSGRKSDTF